MSKNPYDEWERHLRIKEAKRKRQLKAAVIGGVVGGAAGSIAGPAGTMLGMTGGYWVGALANQYIPAKPDTTFKLPPATRYSVSREGKEWLWPSREDVE